MARNEMVRLRIAVGIATAGRPAILSETVAALTGQSRIPDIVFICAPGDADVENLQRSSLRVDVTLGVRGSCIQRNVIIEKAVEEDVVIFFDDDFMPRSDYIGAVEKVFCERADIVMATGNVIIDGILGPGIDVDEARAILAKDTTPPANCTFDDVHSGYGCNM